MKNLTITNLEGLNIMAWNAQLSEEKLNALPLKLRYYLKKLITKLAPDIQEFEKFRDEELKKIQDVYGTDEKSYEVEEIVKDEDGNPVLNEDGKEQTQQIRKIKEEFMKTYQDEISALNEKLMEILSEKNTYECSTYDVSKMVEDMPEDTALTFDDINMLDAIFSDNGEA